MPVRYEITRFGMGFEDRHPLKKDEVLPKLRDRANNLDAPYFIDGDSSGKRYNIEGLMQFVRNHIDALKPGERLVVKGDSYDQPKWVIKAVEVEPKGGQLVKWCEQFIGRSSYDLGAWGPPGPSDCSGMTGSAVEAVYGIPIPHGAELQKNSERIRIFHDASDVEKDDFMFFNYGRLNWPDADHVEFVDKPGVRNIGSRPSTNGVAWYNLQSWDKDNILAFGRLIR